MARKRMFSSEITETDTFYDMPAGAQSMYFHMGILADDLGVVSSPRKIMRTMNASEDDLKILLAKNYLLPIGENLLVITDWLVHNTIRWDRYSPTVFQNEFKKLKLAGKRYSLTEGIPIISIPERKANGESNIQDKLCGTLADKTLESEVDAGNQMATSWQPNGNQMATSWQPNGNQRLPQSSLLESNIVKYSLGQSINNMTELEFLEQIHKHKELELIDGRLYYNLKTLLLNNHKETLNLVEYVNFIYLKMKAYSPYNPSAYFSRCILDLESIRKYENSKSNTDTVLKLEDYTIECPACKNMINQYDDCPYCKLRKDDSKDFKKIEFHQKYFNLQPEVKSEYEAEVNLIYQNIPLDKNAERELAKSQLNQKYGLI